MTQSHRRPALGRGLSALIPGGATPGQHGSSPSATLPIHHLRPAPSQPRTTFSEPALQELADSLRTNGMIQPILVRQVGPQDYAIIAGERRWRAAQRAGLHDVPVVIRHATDTEAFELALVENIQREDLGPLEEAEAYRHLMQSQSLTQEQVAQRVGKDRATVANALRLLKLPERIRADLAAGALTAGHARAILTAPDTETQLFLAHNARENGWSVRETERRARTARKPRADGASTASPNRPSRHEAIEATLRAALGAPCRLVYRGGKGRIEVRFHSLDELDRLVELLAALEGQ